MFVGRGPSETRRRQKVNAAIPPDCVFCAHNTVAKTEDLCLFYVLRFRHEIRERKNWISQEDRGIIQACPLRLTYAAKASLLIQSFQELSPITCRPRLKTWITCRVFRMDEKRGGTPNKWEIWFFAIRCPTAGSALDYFTAYRSTVPKKPYLPRVRQGFGAVGPKVFPLLMLHKKDEYDNL